MTLTPGDWLKLIDFDEFDYIYMAKHALSNVYQEYISKPVGDI